MLYICHHGIWADLEFFKNSSSKLLLYFILLYSILFHSISLNSVLSTNVFQKGFKLAFKVI